MTRLPILIVTALFGCGGSGPELVPVSGEVFLKGPEEPMREISVVFVPKPGSGGLAAGGVADSNGHVVLMTNGRQGVKPADYAIGIMDGTVTVPAMMQKPKPGDTVIPRFLNKYHAAQKSGLEMSVDQNNGTFRFELEPNPKRTNVPTD